MLTYNYTTLIVSPLSLVKPMDIDEVDSGLGTISDVTRTSAAFTHSVDDMSIFSTTEGSSSSDSEDFDEESGLGTISDVTMTSDAFTHSIDDRSIFSSGFRTEVSDEFQVRLG